MSRYYNASVVLVCSGSELCKAPSDNFDSYWCYMNKMYLNLLVETSDMISKLA